MSSFNGSGIFVISGSGLPYVSGTTISSTVANTLDSDLATGLSNTICKDGQSTPTANIPMGGFKLTGLAAPTIAGDALRFENTTAWVPTDQSGAGLVITVTNAGYIRSGGLVTAWADITFPVTADGSNVKLSLPVAATNVTAPGGAFGLYGVGGSTDFAIVDANAATFLTYTSAGNPRINSQYSNTRFRFNARYPAA